MLFPSTLVTSADLECLNPILADVGHTTIVNNPDIFVLTEYTVESVRSINSFLSRSPYSHDCKVVIIPDAHQLNTESQNTLLKNLEEPGEHNHFILLTPRPQSLINTIISRCHVLKINNPLSKTELLTFPQNIIESLALSEKLSADKESVLPFLEAQIRSTPATDFVKLKKLIKATQMLSANLDPKTVLDFLFLS